MDFVTETIARSDQRAISVDVFRPAANGAGATVILLHGGGWRFGDRSAMHGYARLLAEKGFLAIAAQYGLLPDVRWPGQLEDVRAVIRWVKANAPRLNVDPAKVATIGFSAGGHLALLAAGTSDGSGYEQVLGNGAGTSVAAVVSCFAPPSLTSRDWQGRPPQVDMLLDGGGEERARALSPITYVNPAFPTPFLLAGAADIGLPVTATLGLYAALSEAGVHPELHILHAQNHEFSALPSMIGGFVDEVAFFLRRVVVEPEHFAEEDRRLNLFSQPERLKALLAGKPAV
ncbi:alpha/beta fold hydrolase [Bradyrhizobium sp. STM 3561]|uniref:alpha/beta fold hydrolase n=1 Tax=unclassified Bradyrhizobium TaxID=2631580 RepID=UPI003890D31E